MLFSLDTETTLIEQGEIPTLVCATLYSPECVDGPQGWTKYGDGFICKGEASLPAIRKLFESDHHLVLQNSAFDFRVLVKAGLPVELIYQKLERKQVFDTMIRELLILNAEGLLQEQDGHATRRLVGLENLVKIYLQKDISADKSGDSWRKKYESLMYFPLENWPEEAVRYAVDDAILTYRVWEGQGNTNIQTPYPLFLPSGHVVNEPEQVAALFVTSRLELEPLHVDWEAADRFIAKCDLETKKVRAHMSTLSAEITMRKKRHKNKTPYWEEWREVVPVWDPIKGKKSTKALKELVTQAYGGSPPLTEKGGVQYGAQVLAESGDPDLEKIAEGAKWEKLESTYTKIFERAREKGAIFGRYHILVATGRKSSWNPNLQNLPGGQLVRNCIVPRPGYVLSSNDYSAQELGTLAFVCYSLFGHSRLREVINEGTCPHSLLASKILGTTYEDLQARKRAGDPDAIRARKAAKVFNFSGPGGGGAESFVSYAKGTGLILTIEEVRLWLAEWKRQWPEMVQYFAHVNKIVRGHGVVQQLVSNRLRGNVRYTQACNSFFQGLAADMTKSALYLVVRDCEVEGGKLREWGVRPKIVVHDEIICEGPEETAHLWAPHVARLMELPGKKYTPGVKVSVEPALMRRWDKRAEPVYDESGKLLVWEEQ